MAIASKRVRCFISVKCVATYCGKLNPTKFVGKQIGQRHASRGMGRKRDLKNVDGKRPPQLNPEDPDALNEWGEELARMTERRRQHNERHKPGKTK